MRINWLFPLALLFFVSCSKAPEAIVDPFDPAKPLAIKNVSFGGLPLQKADIYLPANRGATTKTLVLVHGGFWTSGDKSELDTLIVPIQQASPDLAIVNMNYRLADGNAANRLPAQMVDIQQLLDLLDSQSDKWHIGKQYHLTGISSGGHLAMLYAYGHDPAKRVKSLGTVIGPTNLADDFYKNQPIFQNLALSLIGKTWQQDSALHLQYSPLQVLKSGAPPTFMAYGGLDPIVPVSNPLALMAKLESLNIIYQYNLYPTETHELTSSTIRLIIQNLTTFIRNNG